MTKNIETIVQEQQQDIPSAIRFTEENAMKNPLFLEALERIKDPREKENFLSYFRQYLSQAYQNNPTLRRMMKSYDLSAKINDLPDDAEDHKKMLSHQTYSEPGRTYPYIDNFMGDQKTKEGMLKRAYHATIGIAKEVWPGIPILGTWYGGNIVRDKAEKGVRAQIKAVLETVRNSKAAPPPIYYELVKRKDWLNRLELIKMPSLYLIGGYILYKTIAYFIKRRRERFKQAEIEKMQELNQGVKFQNQILHQMAA